VPDFPRASIATTLITSNSHSAIDGSPSGPETGKAYRGVPAHDSLSLPNQG